MANKRLLYKYEKPEFHPQNPCKNARCSNAFFIFYFYFAKEAGTRGPLVSLRPLTDPVSKEVDDIPEGGTQGYPLTSTCKCIHVHECALKPKKISASYRGGGRCIPRHGNLECCSF